MFCFTFRNPNEPRLESLFRVLDISIPKCCLTRLQTTQQQNSETETVLYRLQTMQQQNNETEKDESKGTVKICENDVDLIEEITICKNVVETSSQTNQTT